MAALLLFIAILLSFNGYSSGSYCLCSEGVTDTQLQDDIDYACGSVADCSAIQQSGACYQPNTAKSHCDYAVNSYYQKMNQVQDSCNFSGTAIVSSTLPSTVVSGCTFPSSPGQVTAASPTGSPTTTTNGSSTVGTPTSTTGSTIGFGPTATNPSGTFSGSTALLQHTNTLTATLMTLFLSGLMVFWVEGKLFH